MADDDQANQHEGESEQEQNQYGGDEEMDVIEQTKRVTSESEEPDDEAE